MTEKLRVLRNFGDHRNAIINKAVGAGFSNKVVPALLDFLIEELADKPETIQTKFLRNGDLALNLNKKEVIYKGKKTELTAKEFALLEYFMRNPDRVLPHAELLREIWGIPEERANGHLQYLRVYISQLRAKIAHKIIQSRANQGYCLPLML